MANNIPHGMRKYRVQVCTDIKTKDYTSFDIKAYNKDQILDQLSHYFITELDEVTE